MGGVSSKSDFLQFKLRDEFARWPIEAVSNAWKRWHKIRKRNAVQVKRREFFEIFTDYETIVGREFLSLSMKDFDVFDSNNSQTVSAVEVLFLLTLFCHAEIDEKIAVAFEFFDLGKRGGLNMAEMVMLMQAALMGCYHVGIVDIAPKPAALAKLAHEQFDLTDANVDGILSKQEFEHWARANLASQDLLRLFSTKQHMKKLEHRVNSQRDKRLSNMIYELQSDTRTRQAESLGMDKSKSPRRVAKQQFKLTPLADDAAVIQPPKTSYYQDYLKDADRLDQKRESMMRSVIAQQKTLQRMTQITQFTMSDLKRLADAFTKRGAGFDYLSKEAFMEVIADHFPGAAKDAGLREQLFATADTNHDNKIGFREFVCMMNLMLRGSLDEKLELMFHFFDASGDGGIGISELVRMVKMGNEHLRGIIEYTEQIISSFDEDGDGTISIVEFRETLAQEPLWLQMFSNIVTLPSQLARVLHSLAALCTSFTYTELHKRMLAHRRAGTIAPIMLVHKIESCQELSDLMVMMFAMKSAEEMMHLQQAYAIMAKEMKAFALRDFLNCCCKVLTNDRDKQLAFFFDLYDTDGNGTLDRDEIMHMLLSSQQRLSDQATLVVKLLEDFDNDHNGVITLDEFKAQAMRQPAVLTALTTLFWVNRDSETHLAGTNIVGNNSANIVAKGTTPSKHKDEASAQRMKILTVKYSHHQLPVGVLDEDDSDGDSLRSDKDGAEPVQGQVVAASAGAAAVAGTGAGAGAGAGAGSPGNGSNGDLGLGGDMWAEKRTRRSRVQEALASRVTHTHSKLSRPGSKSASRSPAGRLSGGGRSPAASRPSPSQRRPNSRSGKVTRSTVMPIGRPNSRSASRGGSRSTSSLPALPESPMKTGTRAKDRKSSPALHGRSPAGLGAGGTRLAGSPGTRPGSVSRARTPGQRTRSPATRFP